MLGHKRDQANIANCVSRNGIDRLLGAVDVDPLYVFHFFSGAIRRCYRGQRNYIFVEGARTRSSDFVTNQILIYIFN